MSARSELRTLIRLAPDINSTDVISDANVNTLLDKGQIDLSLRGRALPKNEKVNTVAEQREYVISGTSSVLTDNDFLAIDLQGGGVLFYDGSRWISPPEFEPKTREWLDIHQVGWREATSASTPLFWYLDTAEDAVSNLAVGLVDKPSAATANALWINYLSRGKLMTGDTHYPWTGSTTQLVHLEPYEMLLVYYCLDWIYRLILKNDADADKFLNLYLAGAQAMAKRLPLMDHLAREGFETPSYFAQRARSGKRF